MKRGLITVLVFAFLSLGFASAAPHSEYNAFSEKYFNINGNTLTTSDKLVYTTGYYSINGANWVAFPLNGDQYENYPFLLDGGQANLPNELNNPGTHFVIVFSCSLENRAWNCHGDDQQAKWQLEVIRNGNNPGSSCGSNGCEYGEDCYTCPQDCGTCPNPGGTHSLVQNGVARADIVISSNAAPVVDIAAEELQNGIRKMTGVTLPISNSPSSSYDFHVYVGESSYTNQLGITSSGCRDGGYKMVSGDDYLILLGDDREYVVKGPHAADWYDRDDSSIWDEWYRLSGGEWENEYISMLGRHHDTQWDLWEGDQAGSFNAVNQFLYEQDMRWFYLGDIGEVVPSKDSVSFDGVYKTVNPDLPVRDFYLYYMNYFGSDDDDILYRLRLGLNGGDFYRAFPGGHGLRPIAKAFPEYTINGDPDLCSEEFYQETLNYVRKIIDIYDEHEISLMPTDGFWDSYGHASGDCVANTHSDYTWEFMNNIAWDIYNEYGPERTFVSTVYAPYNDAPQHLTKPFAPNLRATFIYSKSELVYDGYRNQERSRIDDWLEIMPAEQFYASTFFLDNRCDLASRNVPIIYPHLLSEDINYLYNKGIRRGGSAEVLTYTSSKYNCDVLAGNSLNIYTSSKLFWDVDLDIDELLNDYYAKFYGPAASKMKEFHEYVEDNYYRADGFPEDTYPGSNGDPSVNAQMRSLLSQARSASGGGIYEDRVDLLIGLMDDCTTGCSGEAPIDGG